MSYLQNNDTFVWSIYACPKIGLITLNTLEHFVLLKNLSPS